MVPPYPTVREFIGDTWEEFSGWDGRFVRTLGALLKHPGFITLEVLEGRRARYVSPLRLYLTASIIYFLVAALTPSLRPVPQATLPGRETITIRPGETLDPQTRAKAIAAVERAPWWMRAFLRSVIENPESLRTRILERFPRVLFVLVPIFAAIVAAFYRGRRFPQHLVFALHLHAVVFLALTVGLLANFTYSRVFAALVQIPIGIGLFAYTLMAFRAVYKEGWGRVLVKSAAIAILYAVVGIAGLIVTLLWAASAQAWPQAG